MSEVIEVELIPERQLFPNPKTESIYSTNNFRIYSASSSDSRVRMNEKYGGFSIKGNMQRLNIGNKYIAKIEGVNDPKYGFGYNVHTIFQEILQTAEEQHDYLKTVMTELQFQEIIKVYPTENIVELIKEEKFDFSKVKGLGYITYDRIKMKIMETLEWQELLSKLGKFGLKYDVLKKLVEHFGSTQLAIQNVTDNPYCLTVLSGIGFKKADVIARNMGVELDSPHRIQSGIVHVILEEQSKGHTYIEISDLISGSYELLQIDTELIENEIDLTEGIIVVDENRIALERTYNNEKYVAEKLVSILDKSNKLDINIEKFIVMQEEKFDIKLSEKQREFFYNFDQYNINFLVGYAGTGKTMMQKLLINIVQDAELTYRFIDEESMSEIAKEIKNEEENSKLNLTYRLLAPTGKSAKVLSSYTGSVASTIHRAIGYGVKDKEKANLIKLTEDVIIIDEVSMLDITLAAMTIKKIDNPRARIVFIGDDYQIPSISCGNFLKDSIDSKVFPITKLDHVFRQSEGGILDIASKIRKGEHFVKNDFVGEMKFGTDTIFRSVEQEWMEDGYKYYYKQLLKSYAAEDIMVLSPTKKGGLGTVSINKNIQSIINPPSHEKPEIKYFEDCTFRRGDYLINVKNTYDIIDVEGNAIEIVNGDMGSILNISKEEEKDGLYIGFDFGEVRMTFDMMIQLLHGWCLTMHKSQGSAAKAVIVIMDKAHKFQLNSNLIYTAITRSREKLYLLCQAETLNFAMRKFENMNRKTFLKEMLIEAKGETKDE